MKKLMIGLAVVLSLAAFAPTQADSLYQQVDVITTNGGTAYADVTVAGALDKIEYVCARGTSTFTVATFAADGTTVVDTYATKQVTAAGAGVIRPRAIGTTTAGVALVGVQANLTNAPSAATTVLVGSYERMRIGGNCKIRLVEDDQGSTAAITNTFRIYLVPSDK